METEFDKILLGFVDLNTQSEEAEAQEQPAAEPVEGDAKVWIIAGAAVVLLAAAAFGFRKKEEEI